MNVFSAFGSVRNKVTDYHVNEDCVKVIDGLTYSVAQMADMVARDLPVNSINAKSLMIQPGQGVQHPTWEVDPSQIRGYDIADAWEAQVASRRKIKDAYVESQKSKE